MKSIAKMTLTEMRDERCASGVCKNGVIAQKTTTSRSELLQFLRNTKSLYAVALGVEILCIAAAEIGKNTGLYLFDFNLIGIPVAYAMATLSLVLQPLLQ
jgi:hypothetical protein